ncbi:MAG: hypothetical protein JNK69_12180 [Saprospiraceae bacterium]|nr:hypothetical protein [Saprospiraceae bacterium]
MIDILNSIITYIIAHFLKILAAFFGYFQIVLPFYQFVIQKKLDEKDKRFRNFHKLIQDLVEAPTSGNIILDRQIAIVYELRNYPQYYELIDRLLTDLMQYWADTNKSDPYLHRIQNEILLTLGYIDYKKMWRLKRLCNSPVKRIILV